MKHTSIYINVVNSSMLRYNIEASILAVQRVKFSILLIAQYFDHCGHVHGLAMSLIFSALH